MFFSFLVLCISVGGINGLINKVGSNLLQNTTDGKFYTVITSEDGNYLDLMTSTTLSSWTLVQGVFSDYTAPLWSDGNRTELLDPDLNVIGTTNVRIYFSARDDITGRTSISVAFADSISGRPYSTLNRPLVSSSSDNLRSPSLLSLSTSLTQTLAFVGSNTGSVHSVNLTADGLQVDGNTAVLVYPTHSWEGGKITRIWSTNKNDKTYIVYKTENGAVGAARSDSAEGPFEKKSQPIGKLSRSKREANLMESLNWDIESGWPDRKSVV